MANVTTLLSSLEGDNYEHMKAHSQPPPAPHPTQTLELPHVGSLWHSAAAGHPQMERHPAAHTGRRSGKHS